MRSTHIQDILPLVEAPSRYLGSEVNTVRKDHRQVKLKFALAFPDLYEIGTSHFGLQILYHILNKRPDVVAERVFTPAPDMQTYLRQREIPLSSLESGCPLGQFDILGFSLLYELNYTNVLAMLDLAGIPLRSNDRDQQHPLIIAGGPCTCNPEPVADFFDALVIGDGEDVVLQMADAWLDWQQKLHPKQLQSPVQIFQPVQRLLNALHRVHYLAVGLSNGSADKPKCHSNSGHRHWNSLPPRRPRQ